MWRTIIVEVALLVCAPPARAAEPELWVYAPVNFQVNDNVDALIALLERAKTAGYSAAVVTDYKFGNPDDRPDHFYANIKRTREAAERIGIELIPCVAPIGYSNSLLVNDPNLAAALPVRDCAMIVEGGKATVADTANLLPGGAFEQGGGHAPAGWGFVDGFGTTSALDREIKHAGGSSLRMGEFRKGNEAGNARAMREVTVKPFHQYRFTMWVRTRGVGNPADFRAAVLTLDGRSLQYTNLGVKADQDWTRHTVTFNSLGYDRVRVYAGLWDGRAGTIWLDDMELREVAGVNLLRREGCPVRVTSDDGATVYEEGRDYAPWRDPQMGAVPWPGEYRAVTDEPTIVIPPGSRIAEGQRLLVSFYHTGVIYDGQVACCLVHDEVFGHVERQVRFLREHLRPRRWFMSHDEVRVAGWCELCKAKGGTCGELLAYNARRCTQIIREIDKDAGVVVWSDMFDPHHNAVDRYYLAASTFAESWSGLDPAVTIANWNGGRREASLRFFGGRGHAQVIAGYYDDARVEQGVAAWNQGVERSGATVSAWMYTTWRNDYKLLERFAAAVRDARAAREPNPRPDEPAGVPSR